jgi:hypothetical protein
MLTTVAGGLLYFGGWHSCAHKIYFATCVKCFFSVFGRRNGRCGFAAFADLHTFDRPY